MKETEAPSYKDLFVRAGRRMAKQVWDRVPSNWKLEAARLAINTTDYSNGNSTPEAQGKAEQDPEVLLQQKLSELRLVRDRLPETVVIIPDGNRREGKNLGISDEEAHDLGARMLYDSLRVFEEFTEVKNVILWAWSEDNETGRPNQKAGVFRVLTKNLRELTPDLHRKKARIKRAGRVGRLRTDIHGNPLPDGDALIQEIERSEGVTKDNDGVNIILAIDYGERYERRRYSEELKRCSIDPDFASDEELEAVQDRSREIPIPDLVVRTSGEKRLSRFPFSNAAELVFIDTNLPAIQPFQIAQALKEYTDRDRRGGR